MTEIKNDKDHLDDYCEECGCEDESVSQNLLMFGYKICASCKICKTIFPIDLINCNCQKLVSLDISLIKLSCKDKIITPKTNIISEEKGLSLTCGLKKSNLTIFKPK